MDPNAVAQYIGYAYGALAGARLILNGVKALAGLNGTDGPEDRAIGKAEAFLNSADALVARFVPNPVAKKS